MNSEYQKLEIKNQTLVPLAKVNFLSVFLVNLCLETARHTYKFLVQACQHFMVFERPWRPKGR